MAIHRVAVISRSVVGAVTLGDAKHHVGLGESNASHDSYLLSLIEAATLHVESRTGRAIMQGTWDFFRDRFPTGIDPIRLPLSPLSSVTSLKYYATDGTLTTWGTSNYLVKAREPGEIHLAPTITWPAQQLRPEGIEIRFVAGYGTDFDDVPAGIRQAILLLVGHWFEQRTAVNVGNNATDIPLGFNALCDQYSLGDEFTCYGGKTWDV